MSAKYNLKLGCLLGRQYRVIEYLGCGWEGEVYKVEERETGILRAAKLFYPKKNYGKARHIDYAKKLYRLKTCPIVIQYHHKDVVYVNNQAVDFLVSDFVEGEVLSGYLARQRGKRLSSFEALHLIHALTIGIEHIHFIGEYHGDIHSDNIIVRKKGLKFQIHLIDILHIGKSNKERIQQDVFDLIAVFHEILGGAKGYQRCADNIRQIILGRKHSLIRQHFNMAGHLRIHLDNLEWD